MVSVYLITCDGDLAAERAEAHITLTGYKTHTWAVCVPRCTVSARTGKQSESRKGLAYSCSQNHRSTTYGQHFLMKVITHSHYPFQNLDYVNPIPPSSYQVALSDPSWLTGPRSHTRHSSDWCEAASRLKIRGQAESKP